MHRIKKNTSGKGPGARRGFLVPVLLLAALLLAAALLPGRRKFQAPRQEYENNTVKKSTLIFSKPSGFYEDAFVLQISAPTDEIYYTLDGTEPVRGQEGTFRYSVGKNEGIEITDATPQENVYSMRTDVTTGFDEQAVEELSKGQRLMHYRVPDYPVDKCTVLRAAYYKADGGRSAVETGVYFIGYDSREGFGSLPVISIVTDPANLFDYETGIYVTGKTFDDFAAADSFHDSSIWYRHVWWWWDANYHNKGREWERPADIQFFGGDGSLLLQQQAGIRIQGGGSRGFLPKSLNLYARKEYGGNTSFHCDFFGTGYEAKRLTLTSCGDDYYTKCKDRLVSELAANQDFSTMHYEPCLLFLDGEFWGFYYLTEKYDERYFSYYYGVPEEEVIEIKNGELESSSADSSFSESTGQGGTGQNSNDQGSLATRGGAGQSASGQDALAARDSAYQDALAAQDSADLALYREMKEFIENSDMSLTENYEKACALIDMDSFVNYYAALIYCARCGDWPGGNYALWRTRTASGSEVPAAEMAEDTGTPDSAVTESSGTSAASVTSTSSGTSAASVISTSSGTSAASVTSTSSDSSETSDASTQSEKEVDYHDGRWRWVLFDVNSAAISSDLATHDTLASVLNTKSMQMFKSLWANPAFRELFSARILEYGQTIFSPDAVNEALDGFLAQMEDPMAIHFRRFFGADSGLDFPQIVQEEIRDFFGQRYEIVKDLLKSYE